LCGSQILLETSGSVQLKKFRIAEPLVFLVFIKIQRPGGSHERTNKALAV
jgi:hypothetical protein